MHAASSKWLDKYCWKSFLCSIIPIILGKHIKGQWKYIIHLHYHTIMSFQTHLSPQVRYTLKFIFVNMVMLVWLRKAMWPISILSFMICWAFGVIFIIDFRKNNSLFPRISLHKLLFTRLVVCSSFATTVGRYNICVTVRLSFFSDFLAFQNTCKMILLRWLY